MQDNMTMAEVGSIVNVNGNRIATPFGPPRPGNTPTKMPSTRPKTMSAMIFHVISTAKPFSSNPNASISSVLAPECAFERALGHDDVECHVEHDEHQRCKNERCYQRFPPRNL